MKQIKKVLVIIDANADSMNQEVELPIELRKALRLFRDADSTELHLFSVAYQKHLNHDSLSWDFDQEQKREEYCDGLKSYLNHLSEKLQSEGINCNNEVVWGYPRYDVVISKATELGVDLIVQHTRSYGKLEFHHLTNDSWQLVRNCSIPLLLVKNDEWNASPILIAAVDPMHSHNKPLSLDTDILDSALTLEEKISGNLHVVHAYAEAARPFAPAGVIEKEHSEALTEFLSDYSLAEDQLHFMNETAIAALQKKARDLNADILVMGALSRSRLSEMLIGSTAEKVLDFLETDVLIISPTR